MYRWLVVASVGFVLSLGGSARADSARLAEARRAVEEVRYDRAEELLGAALRDGGNAPETMLEIYKLAAITAVVLGKEELAEQYYRRLLSLDPKAKLDEGVAPKFKRPFAAAQAHVNAHGALRVRTRRADRAVEVVIDSDPLSMVAAVALHDGGGDGKPARFTPERRAVVPLGDDDAGGEGGELVLLDELGNELQALPVPAAEVVLPEPPARKERPSAKPSFLRTWWIWTIPATASLGVGIVTGLQSQQASADLDALLRTPNPYYGQADYLKRLSRQRATIANISFAAAGVFAIVAGVMLVTRPSDKKPPATALAPMLGGDGTVGVSLSGAL